MPLTYMEALQMNELEMRLQELESDLKDALENENYKEAQVFEIEIFIVEQKIAGLEGAN